MYEYVPEYEALRVLSEGDELIEIATCLTTIGP